MRLEALLAAAAARRPDHPALVCGELRLTYAELHASVQRVAAGLRLLGVAAGDRVLLYLNNGIELVQIEYAAFTLGAIAVPVNTRLAAREIEHVLADAQPAAIVYHPAGRDALRELPHSASGPRRIVLGAAEPGETPFAALLAAPLPDAPVVLQADAAGDADPDDCMILYTSGTTGRPKGAVLSHAGMVVQNLFLHGLAWDIGADDRYLAITSLALRAGVSRLVNALGFGGTLVIMEHFEPGLALELIERERITVTGLVPTAIRMLLPLLRERPQACRSLRRIIVGTEAFPAALKKELIALLPQAQIHSNFAMTEALVTNLDHAGQLSHPDSVGRALPGVEIRIVDDSGKDVASGETGELLVRSGAPGRYAVFGRYFNRPEETAAAIRGGWFHTGDMARRDAAGYIYIVDRKKDMVLSGGFNIYSKEVERVLESHPQVAEAAVIGVPDAIYGEAVAAFIRAREDARPGEQALIEHCRAQLASYKKPKHIFFVDSLPRNPTGKVLKNELRERAARIMRSS